MNFCFNDGLACWDPSEEFVDLTSPHQKKFVALTSSGHFDHVPPHHPIQVHQNSTTRHAAKQNIQWLDYVGINFWSCRNIEILGRLRFFLCTNLHGASPITAKEYNRILQ